ncbi:DNA topoisomerase 2-like [Magnolia sinica]|uniref:DNA topoisomerase 2-like n=1 Tax=Magnolia sinica TaxID=86752 RepID=UPI00265B1FCD|nr:DNA topoisomerase 2-like [Magnolia sinica]
MQVLGWPCSVSVKSLIFSSCSVLVRSLICSFDARGVIKKYDSPEKILEEFFHLRLEFYVKRKKVMLDNLEIKLLRLFNKVRFIIGVVEGEIIVSNRKRADLVLELQQKGFTSFLKTKGIDTSEAMEIEENEETPEVGRVARASDYEYLLSMPIGTLMLEKVQELLAEKGKQEMEVEELKKETPKSLWMKDLDAFITTEHEKEEAQVEEVT